MDRTRLAPPQFRRLAIFLVAIALVAAISPALAVAANGPPQPVDDPVNTAEDVPISGNVLDNDGNQGEGPLSVTALAALPPTIGTINWTTDGDFDFTPAADWNGSASTTYTVYNGKHSRPGYILITVTPADDAPVANDDTVSVTEDTATDVTAQVLANDTDADGDTRTVSAASNPTGGSVDFDAGTVTFTPTADLCGDAAGSFDYDIGDGNGGHDSASVTVDITCVNEAPDAVNDTVSVTEDTATDVTAQVLDNDTDANGDTLTVSGASNPTGGSVDFDAGTVTFTPTADLCGDAAGSFDYDIGDGNGGHDSASVTVDITCVNEAPDAVNDTVSVTEDTATDVTAQVLDNDTDANGDTLTVSGASNPTGGSVDFDAGTVTFTPTADLCGDAAGSFDYDIGDGNGGHDSASVTVDITCVNDAPVAFDDTGSVANNPGATDFDVLVNDTDVEGGLSLVSATVSASAGSASVVAGKVRFTPLAMFSGNAVISYVVSDGALQDSGSLTVTVGPDTTLPVATAPTVTFGAGRVDESAPLLVSWSSGDVGSGVVAHELQVSIAGGSFTTIYSGAGTSYTKLFPFNKTLVWRVRATDAATNVSPWATAAARRIVAYQGTNAGFTYTGTWTRVSSAGSSGTDYRYTTSLGRRVTLAFTGREVLYVAPKTNSSGYAKVYVDGTLVGRFNLRTSIAQPGRIIARATWSANGGHTIRVVNDQAGRKTNLDAFVVLK